MKFLNGADPNIMSFTKEVLAILNLPQYYIVSVNLHLR